MKADIGLIGLAVMGENLALNMESKGFTVAVYNRSVPGEEGVVDRFVSGRGKGRHFIGTHSIGQLVDSVKSPHVIMMMVKAGCPVDELVSQLLPFLSPGDVIIDGGNSDFHDTERRVKELEEKGIYFVGTGISGGEEGALHGPSVMPGGSADAWPLVKGFLQGISVKLDDGSPCCEWIGTGGAGHFVKMVHNGIEYGDMQLISEAYSLLKRRKGLDNDAMAVVFDEWNGGELDSFLIEITARILRFRDEDGKPLLDKILDVAGQKGTGKWSAIAAMDENDPLTLITEAVYARLLSALYPERVKAARLYNGQLKVDNGQLEEKENFNFQLKTSVRHYTQPSWFPMHKDSLCFTGLPFIMAGSWITGQLLVFGVKGVSSVPSSCKRSRMHTGRSRTWKTCSSMTFSVTRYRLLFPLGAGLSPKER